MSAEPTFLLTRVKMRISSRSDFIGKADFIRSRKRTDFIFLGLSHPLREPPTLSSSRRGTPIREPPLLTSSQWGTNLAAPPQSRQRLWEGTGGYGGFSAKPSLRGGKPPIFVGSADTFFILYSLFFIIYSLSGRGDPSPTSLILNFFRLSPYLRNGYDYEYA